MVEPLPESDGDLKVDYVVMLGGDGDDEIALQIKSAGRTRLFVVPERTSRKSNDEGAFCRGVHRYRQMRRAETGRSDMDVLPVIARISTDLQNGAGLSNSEVFLAVRDLVNRYVGEEEVSAVI